MIVIFWYWFCEFPAFLFRYTDSFMLRDGCVNYSLIFVYRFFGKYFDHRQAPPPSDYNRNYGDGNNYYGNNRSGYEDRNWYYQPDRYDTRNRWVYLNYLWFFIPNRYACYFIISCDWVIIRIDLAYWRYISFQTKNEFKILFNLEILFEFNFCIREHTIQIIMVKNNISNKFSYEYYSNKNSFTTQSCDFLRVQYEQNERAF